MKWFLFSTSVLFLTVFGTGCETGPEYVKKIDLRLYLEGGSVGVITKTSKGRELDILVRTPDVFETKPESKVILYLVDDLPEKKYLDDEIVNPSTRIAPGSKREAQLLMIFAATAHYESVDEKTRKNCAIVTKLLRDRNVDAPPLGWQFPGSGE